MLRITLILCLVNVILCYKPNWKLDLTECRPDCDSEIFCRGELLHDVQTNQVFEDGTTFVEKRLLYSEKEIVGKYKELKKKFGGTPPVKELRKFVDQNFANDSLSTCDFPDFTQNPSILKKTNKEKYKKWLTWLNNRWLELGGMLADDVKTNPDRHSYLYVPNNFIKAGGRFTGTYYWDSYWIIRGILLCDMKDTAREIMENIIYLVDRIGYMPNGNRIYYKQRSQPPMLIQMAAAYYDFTKNSTFIKVNLPAFRKEFQFWNDHRSILVEKGTKKYKMFRYKTLSCDPRPESYNEDYELVKNITDPEVKVRIFTGVRSAAESGWDFSSRHFRGKNNSIDGTLRQMDSMNMIYVDLNAIIHSNLVILSEWHKAFGLIQESKYYEKEANNLLEGIEQLLWNEKDGIWYDYDLITDQSREYFFVSNFVPLWSNSYTKKEHVPRVIQYLKTSGIIKKDLTPKYYCVPTSLDNSTQQWDFPNCWAPLQAFLIYGLEKSNNKDAKKVAFNLAQMLINTTYEGWRNSSEMYEKYDAIEFGSTGGGGEYSPQTGFGWTNGLIISLFDTWCDKLE